MRMRRLASTLALFSTLLAFFSLLLAQAWPASPRYGPYVDQWWFSIIIGPDAQLSALLQHEVDGGGVPRPTDIGALDAAGFTLPNTVRLGMSFLFENNLVFPTSDINFRMAVHRLVDKDALTELLYPLQSPLHYWLPPSMGDWVADGQWDPSWGQYRPDYPLPWFNPGMPTDTGTGSAYSYLNDGGFTMTTTPNPWYGPTSPSWASPYLRTYSGGGGSVIPEIEYVTRPSAESPLYYEQSVIICNALQQAGINVQLITKTWLQILGILQNEDSYDYGLMIVGIEWSVPWPEILYALFYSESPYNFCFYSNQEMDDWLEYMKSTQDYNELKEAVMQVQRILCRDEPSLPLMMYNGWTAFTGDYSPTNPGGYIGIVNAAGSGATGGTEGNVLVGPSFGANQWGKLIGQSGRTASPQRINLWSLGVSLDTLNPLTTISWADWQVLDLVRGFGGVLNPYTSAYMPWALASEPTQEAWGGPNGELGAHMYFTLRQGLMWHDGEPITAADAVFCLNLMRFQQVFIYRSIWSRIYDVVQTGTYTWEVWYLQRYYYAARAVGDICFLTPVQTWGPFIQPTIQAGAGPLGGDIWTGWVGDYRQWRGWEWPHPGTTAYPNLGTSDTYNGYADMGLTQLIGFGPFIYHAGGWVPAAFARVEANPYYMAIRPGDGLRICPGDVNLDQYCDGRDVWQVLRRQGQEEYQPIWYVYLGSGPSLQGPSVDIIQPAQLIDMAENSVMRLHTGHWWGIGDPPTGYTKEPPG